MEILQIPDHAVFVVDDDERVREALAGLFAAAELNALFFSSALEYLRSSKPDCPGCLIVDVGLSDINGLELQARISQDRRPPIVFITGRGDIPTSVRAMKAGAVDFLTKPFNEKELLAAVAAAIEKDREIRARRAERRGLLERLSALTPRERQVMSLVASGLLNKQAAFKLGISEVTLQIHRGKVMKKLKAKSLADLVRMVDSIDRS